MTEWIISSSILILGILGLRRLLRGKVSLRLQYALWLVVLVRLLCPVNFFQSGISVQNAVNSILEQEISHSVVVEPRPGQAENHLSQEEVGGDEIPSHNENQSELPEDLPPQSADTPVRDIVTVNDPEWFRIAGILWLAGAVVMLSFMLGCNYQFMRMLARNRRALEVPDASVPVYVSSWVRTPCLAGVFRPMIYLTPEVEADISTWNHVIRHEMTHLEHFDHVFSLLRCVALCLHWYNPLVWIGARVSKEDGELACDEGTIRRLGEGERVGYGQTLIRLTCRSHNPSDLMLAATTMVGTKGGIRQRIKCLAKKPKTLAYALVICVLAVGFMVGCTFTGAVDTTEPEETMPTETTLPENPTESEYITEPTETEPVDEDVINNNWLRMNVTPGAIDYPEELFQDFLTCVETVYRSQNGTSAYISYIGLEEGCEQITDQGLWMYRMEFRVDGPTPYESDRLFLYYHENDPGAEWRHLETYNDGWIEQYVSQGRIPAELVKKYGSESIAAAVWHWQEYTAPITEVEDADRLIDWMCYNGGMKAEHNGTVTDCRLDGWERARWARFTSSYHCTEAAPHSGNMEYVKISDALGNYLCIYDYGYMLIEMCEAGCEPTWWLAESAAKEEDWFMDYLMLYYREGVDFTQYTCYAENHQEALEIFGQMIADRHLNVGEDNPYYALESRIIREPMVGDEVMIGFVAEDGTWAEGSVYYAIRQPELSYMGYGNVNEGTGEWEGWLMINQWFTVTYLGDGLWQCGSA